MVLFLMEFLKDWSRNKKGKLHSLSWENLSISLRQRGSQSFDYSSYEMFLEIR